jgi:hypothetical protein
MAYSGHIIMRSVRGQDQVRRRAPTRREMLEERLRARPEAGLMDAAKTRTREEKARAGIDAMTKAELDSAARQGITKTETEARTAMQALAERAEKKRDK